MTTQRRTLIYKQELLHLLKTLQFLQQTEDICGQRRWDNERCNLWWRMVWPSGHSTSWPIGPRWWRRTTWHLASDTLASGILHPGTRAPLQPGTCGRLAPWHLGTLAPCSHLAPIETTPEANAEQATGLSQFTSRVKRPNKWMGQRGRKGQEVKIKKRGRTFFAQKVKPWQSVLPNYLRADASRHIRTIGV